MRRVTFQITDEAHDKMRELKKAWGVPQFDMITLILENIDPDAEPFRSKARELREAKKVMKNKKHTLINALATLSEEELAEALRVAQENKERA